MMTDKKGLRLLGWAYGGLTAIVLLVAFTVVSAHVNAPVAAHASSTERFAVLPR